jgi:hypothetical protein
MGAGSPQRWGWCLDRTKRMRIMVAVLEQASVSQPAFSHHGLLMTKPTVKRAAKPFSIRRETVLKHRRRTISRSDEGPDDVVHPAFCVPRNPEGIVSRRKGSERRLASIPLKTTLGIYPKNGERYERSYC